MSSTGDCFIFVTDTHYKGVNPVSRIDDYSASILEKLSEVVEAAEKENAACIIIGGDLNDIPRMADQQAGRLAEVLNRTRRCKFVVPGSHDLYGYSMDSLYQTKLGLLIKSGVVELLSRETGPVYIHLTDQVDGTVWRVSIEGQEFTSEIDTRDPAYDYWVKSDAPISVLATHSMLLDKPFHPGVPQTLISDFPDSTEIEAIYGPGYRAPDVVLAGHYHPGWPIQKKGNTVFANPGSLARNSATPDSFTSVKAGRKFLHFGRLNFPPPQTSRPVVNRWSRIDRLASSL